MQNYREVVAAAVVVHMQIVVGDDAQGQELGQGPRLELNRLLSEDGVHIGRGAVPGDAGEFAGDADEDDRQAAAVDAGVAAAIVADSPKD